MKIKLKDIVLKYSMDNKIILRYNSELIEIEDEEGDISYLFYLLNLVLDESEIISRYIDKYQNSGNKIYEYLNTLKDLSVIEYIYECDFDDYTQTRWSRNFDFFSSLSRFGINKYECQKEIFNAKICLLGCGGLGSHILYELAATGFKNITIVDFDKIELSNLNRQILYKESDIGKSKVHTAHKNILDFNPNIKINSIEKQLTSEKDISTLIKGHHLVICVADKPRGKIIDWLNKACVKGNIPYINGGLNLARSSFYSVIPYITGCANCWLDSIKGIQKDILSVDISENYDYSSPAPAFSALVAITAGVMVSEAVRIITKIVEPSLTNKLKIYDFRDCEIKTVEKWERNNQCSVCGGELCQAN